MITDIHACQRKDGETPNEFSTRFEGMVARYSNHTGHLSDDSNRQFAVLSIHNARLTADTFNALTFRLTSTVAGASDQADNTHV